MVYYCSAKNPREDTIFQDLSEETGEKCVYYKNVAGLNDNFEDNQLDAWGSSCLFL